MAKTFTRLTRIAMRKLKPDYSIVEHGICFKRTQSKDGVFSVNVMVDGQRIHRVVGRESDGTTRQQAMDYIDKLRHDAKMGRLALPKRRKIALTFANAAQMYLMKLKEEGGKDLKMKSVRLRKHLLPFFGDKQLAAICGYDVERYKKSRLAESAQRGKKKDGSVVLGGKTKPATVNRELAVLSHLLNKAVEWGWLEHRSAAIRRIKEDNARLAYLTVEQVEKVLCCAIEDQNPQIYPFMLIALKTSMRLSEILSMSRENVDVDRKLIYVPKAKAGAREQPMSGELAEFLLKYIQCLPKGSSWIFPSPTSRLGHTVDIRKPFRRVIAAAGLNPDVVVRHTLRHTAITHLVQAGVDLPTVMRISGHKTLAMVERYAHQNGEHVGVSLDKLEARYKVKA